MHPIAIVAILGALGFAVFKFLKQPTVEVERDLTPQEKAMKDVDDALGAGLDILSGVMDGADWFLSRLIGEKTRTSEAVLFERIWRFRNAESGPLNYYSTIKAKAPIYYYTFLGIPSTKWDQQISGYNKAEFISGGIGTTTGIGAATTGVDAAREAALRPFGWNDKVLAAEKSIFDFIKGNSGQILIDDHGTIVNPNSSFQHGVSKASLLNQFKWREIPLGGKFGIDARDNPRYENIVMALAPDVNNFQVFTGMPFTKPWLGAEPDVTYYLVTLFPGEKNTFGIFAILNASKTKIVKLVQKKIASCYQKDHLKIGRLAYFGEMKEIFAGFYHKHKVTGKTYTATLTG